MKNNKEEDSDEGNERLFSIPLMFKRENSVQKYINGFKMADKSKYSSSQHSIEHFVSCHKSRTNLASKHVALSNYGQTNNRSHINYSPLKDQIAINRVELLDKVELEYQRLKENFSHDKDPFLSKFTHVLKEQVAKDKRKNSRSSILNYSMEEIHKDLKKQVTDEEGKKVFPDLEFIRKGRTRLLDSISRGKKMTTLNEGEQINQLKNKLMDIKLKEVENQRKKMLQKKGLHWNVYYDLMALGKQEKENLKNQKNKFIEIYGS